MIKFSTLKLFHKLATGNFSKQPDFHEFKNRFKFLTRGLATLPYTLQWLEFLNETEAYRDFLCMNPRISTKLHRPYIFSSNSLKNQLSILKFHHTLQKNVFSQELQRTLLACQSLTLANLTGKNSEEYRITLSQNLIFEKEGELLLRLYFKDKVLFVISFSFYQTKEEKLALVVGGIQGGLKGDDYTFFKEATKSCYGLFPKKLAMEAIMELGRQLGINTLHLISNDGHIYKHWRYTKKKILADYDIFWKELGATKIDKQLYELLYPIYHKPLEEIESKKRSEYKKRQLLLEELENQISTFFVTNVKKAN